MKLALDDEDMDAQLQRTLAAAPYGAADVGEALAVARRATPGDYGSWFDEWAGAAQRRAEDAERQQAGGHRTSAQRSWLAASEYWRQAFFFLRHDPDDERLQRAWRAHRDTFRSALDVLDVASRITTIEVDGTPLTAYLLSDPAADEPRPVVLAPCGYDSTAEAGWSTSAAMALDRGWSCCLFEGPGQGGALYDHRVPMRPDFEVVFGPVLDWVVEQPEVDTSRIGVIGRSFAGNLAARGVADDDRVGALVLDPGQYDFVSRMVPTLFDEAYWQRIVAGDEEVDQELQGLLDGPRNQEWYGARMATLGATRVAEFLRRQATYTLEPVIDRISCPTLLTEGEGDFAAQTGEVATRLTGPVTVHRFDALSGADGHCEGMGSTQFEAVAFDWLAETLAS